MPVNDPQADLNIGGDPDFLTPPALLDSYAPFEVQIIIPTFTLEGDQGGFLGGFKNLLNNLQGYDIGAHNVLQDLRVEFVSDRAWTASITVFDPNWAITNALGLIPARLRHVRFRFNWQKLGFAIDDVALLDGLIAGIEPEYRPEGTTLKIDLIDALADGVIVAGDGTSNTLGQLTSRQLGYRRFAYNETTATAPPTPDSSSEPTGNGEARVTAAGQREPNAQRVLYGASEWSPSHIFATIAEAIGWNYVAEASVRFDPEEVTGLEFGADETTIQFIKNKLIPRARNSRNENFLFYTDIDPETGTRTAHFHSPSFLTSRIAREYTYVRDVIGDVIEFSPSDDGYYVSLRGGMDSTYVSFNAESGQPGEMVARAEMGVQTLRQTAIGAIAQLTQEVPHVHQDADNVDNTRAGQTQTGRPEDQHVESVPDRGDDGALNRARAHYAQVRLGCYNASLTVKGTHAVRMLDFVRVNYFDTASTRRHPLSGVYRVVGVVHELGSGGWTTQFTLIRGNRPTGQFEGGPDQSGTIPLTNDTSENA